MAKTNGSATGKAAVLRAVLDTPEPTKTLVYALDAVARETADEVRRLATRAGGPAALDVHLRALAAELAA